MDYCPEPIPQAGIPAISVSRSSLGGSTYAPFPGDGR